MGACASKPPSSSTASTHRDDDASPRSETRATDRDATATVSSTGRRRDGVSTSTSERVGVIVVNDEGGDDGSSSSGSSVDERVVQREARDVDEDATAAAAATRETTTANATTPAKATRVEAIEDVDASVDRGISSKRAASASTSEPWVRVGETRMTMSPVESEAAARRRRSESEDDKATIEALRRALADKLPSSSTPQKAPDGSVLMASAVRPSASAARRARDRGERPYRGETTTSANRPSRRGRDDEFLERNRSDDEDAERRRRSAQKPPANKDDVEKRARRQLRKQARDDVEREMVIKTAVRARVEDDERRRDGTDADAGESPLVSVVTPRSSLKIKVPTPSAAAADSKPRGSGAERYGKSPRNSYNSKLDELLAVAERAGSTAERVRDQITDLEQRVELNNLKPIAVQPWQEHGNAWAGDRHSKGDRHSRHSKSARSERSSSAGTILNPKNKNSREMRVKYEHARSDGSNSTPTTPEKPKIITSVLRSDLLKSMGEMSADEKLKRLGLKPVPEVDDAPSPTNSNPWPSAPRGPSPARREWRERMSPAQAPRSTYSGDDGENGFSPPPPSVGSHRDNGAESPANYLGKLKAQAKLARSESAKSWKPGVGVQIGRAL